MSFDNNTPAAATPAASPTPSTPAPSVTPSTATPVASPQPATPAAPAPTEDRSTWVPPYRLRETATKYETQLATLKAQADAEKAALTRQLQALTGVLPPQNPEIDQVKSQFKSVFPELDEIGSNAAAIKELIALKDEMQASIKNQQAAHNRNAINALYKAAEGTYGTSLNEDAKRSLGSSFVGYLQANPEEYEKYHYDPTSVVNGFWTAFTERFISPIQRQQAVATQNRIPGAIPQDAPAGAVPVSQPVKQFASQDDRLNAALANYKANLKTGF